MSRRFQIRFVFSIIRYSSFEIEKKENNFGVAPHEPVPSEKQILSYVESIFEDESERADTGGDASSEDDAWEDEP